jgi:hypothetical protein
MAVRRSVTRRGRGEANGGVGSVEVLPSGRFRVRVRVNGRKTGDTFATRDEAEQQRATLAVRHRQVAEALPPVPKGLTLAAWGKTWLERRVELGLVRRPAEDCSRWGRYITGSSLDPMRLREIRPKHINAWSTSW